jgi:hypothetical protein
MTNYQLFAVAVLLFSILLNLMIIIAKLIMRENIENDLLWIAISGLAIGQIAS